MLPDYFFWQTYSNGEQHDDPSIHFLPDEIFTELARRAPRQDERTDLIAEALRYFFATHQTNDSELEKINSYAEELNQEAEDVLNYQVIR